LWQCNNSLIFSHLQRLQLPTGSPRLQILAKIERILAKIFGGKAFTAQRKSLCGEAIGPLSHCVGTFTSVPKHLFPVTNRFLGRFLRYFHTQKKSWNVRFITSLPQGKKANCPPPSVMQPFSQVFRALPHEVLQTALKSPNNDVQRPFFSHHWFKFGQK
jgi:hypothetical protein